MSLPSPPPMLRANRPHLCMQVLTAENISGCCKHYQSSRRSGGRGALHWPHLPESRPSPSELTAGMGRFRRPCTRSSQSTISQPRHYTHLGLAPSLWRGLSVQCRTCVASLASVHQLPGAPFHPEYLQPKVFTGIAKCPLGAKSPPVENH